MPSATSSPPACAGCRCSSAWATIPRAVRAGLGALGHEDTRERSAALEMLEVSLGRSVSALVLALVDPALDDDARRRALDAWAPVVDADRGTWLRRLVTDDDDTWQDPWLRACALYALPSSLPAEAPPSWRRRGATTPTRSSPRPLAGPAPPSRPPRRGGCRSAHLPDRVTGAGVGPGAAPASSWCPRGSRDRPRRLRRNGTAPRRGRWPSGWPRRAAPWSSATDR